MFDRARQPSQQRPYDSGDHEYTIRTYRDSDRDQLLSLYQDVLDPSLTSEWFEWKYETNPYTDGVPSIVAEYDGQVVGAAGFWILEAHTGSRSTRVVQPCDGAVRPAHRRQGLYTEIFRLGLDRISDAGYEFAFDFPNELSQATFEKYGWQAVERRETYFRVQQPEAMVGRSTGPLSSLLTTGAQLLARGYLGVKDRRRSVSGPSAIDVERTDEIPAATLATLYRRAVPDEFHLVRDETFYEWRFGNPQWDYAAYVARYDGSPVAAVVTGTKIQSGVPVTRLTDIVPLVSNRARTAGFVSVLEAVLENDDDTSLLAAPPGVIPESVLSAYGFRSDRSLPFSLVATPTVHGVYALRGDDETGGDRWVVDGKRLSNPDSWRITFSEQDTG